MEHAREQCAGVQPLAPIADLVLSYAGQRLVSGRASNIKPNVNNLCKKMNTNVQTRLVMTQVNKKKKKNCHRCNKAAEQWKLDDC